MLNIQNFKSIKKDTKISLPEYPTKWKPVKEFPNLSSVRSLAIDTETYDPELLTAGPGWARGCGNIIGISLATEDAAWYFPIRHQIQTELNLNPENVLSFIADAVNTNIPKVFANAQYDCGWLAEEGITVKGKWYDVIAAERLLDSTLFDYSLETISNKYLGEGKLSTELYDWCARAYGGKPDGKQRSNLYRTPPSLVGPYAEIDAVNPFKIIKKQMKLLQLANLDSIFDIETRLLPLLVAMRMRGTRISEEKALLAKAHLNLQIKQKLNELKNIAGFQVNPNSGSDLARMFAKLNIQVPLTAKGNPSITAPWLENEPHLAASLVRDIRKARKTISTFIDGAILEKNVNGIVYTSFNPLKPITGRFSSANPNLQNIPKRDKIIGPLLRGMFLPDEGFPSWLKADYSSIEFRLFVNFIKSSILLNAYRNNPFTDFHQVVIDMIQGGLPRVVYKTISFTRMFGGGADSIAKQIALNFDRDQILQMIQQMGYSPMSMPERQLANIIIKMYDEKFPMVKDAIERATEIINTTGEIRTVLGRRMQFNMWEPIYGKKIKSLPYAQARAAYGTDIKRANTYKGLNAYTQGSSADIIKKAMVDCWEAGLFASEKIGAPHLTVHDELDFSYHPDLNNYFIEVQNIMENSTKIDVPIIVETELGSNWGSCKKFNLKKNEYI